jgi:hypothetical protein
MLHFQQPQRHILHYHENAVARASSLQTGCLRYIFIIVGAARGMKITPQKLSHPRRFLEHCKF